MRCGGGFNHRFGLDDAMLIKDNHIAVAGGVRAGARARARQRRPSGQDRDRGRHPRPACARCSTTGLADVVLLDNMGVDELRKAVEMTAGRVLLEASGGITLETIAAVAATGVDYASSGWITHSAPSLDVALDIEM